MHNAPLPVRPFGRKRARQALRKVLLKPLRRHWRRCWWTWPLGHDWPATCWRRGHKSISHCGDCGKPVDLVAHSEYDLIELYEEAFARDVDDDFPEEMAGWRGAL